MFLCINEIELSLKKKRACYVIQNMHCIINGELNGVCLEYIIFIFINEVTKLIHRVVYKILLSVGDYLRYNLNIFVI